MSDITITSGVSAVIKETTKSLKDSILITANNIAVQAKELAPKMTGQLEGSIGYGLIDEKTAHASAGVEYSTYVEFGTKTQAAQPYLRPAKSLAQGKNVEDVKKKIALQVEYAAKIREKIF